MFFNNKKGTAVYALTVLPVDFSWFDVVGCLSVSIGEMLCLL